jgi:hypothetical protein
MKKIKTLLLLSVLLTAFAAQAQTVDEIINNYITALGGKDLIGQVKSIYTENSLEVMGSSTNAVEHLLQGKGFKSESEFNGMKIINCYTDKSGWLVNPFQGSSDPQAMPDEAYASGKDQIYFGGSLIDYAEKGNKAELAEKENNQFKIKVTSGNIEKFYFIDPSTWHLTKVTSKGEMMGQSIEVVITYSDYKKTDFGILLPYSRTTDLGSFSLAYKLNKVEVNKEMDSKIFEMQK